MMIIKRLFVLSALTLGSFAVAHATSISGILNIGGSDNFQLLNSTDAILGYAYELSFVNASLGLGDTGAFAILPANSTVSLFPTFGGAPLPFNLGYNPVPVALIPLEVLTVSGGGETFDFYMTDYTASIVSGVIGCSLTCLDVTGDGYFTGSGSVTYSNTPGTFTFATPETSVTQTTDTTFGAIGLGAPAPEPSSVALLGTGLLGVVGVMRRRYMGKANV